MSDVFTEDARKWVDILVQRECRGNDDTENAMRRLGRRHKMPWRWFWSLKYRPPKHNLMGTYIGIRNAYERALERQIALLQTELAATTASA